MTELSIGEIKKDIINEENIYYYYLLVKQMKQLWTRFPILDSYVILSILNHAAFLNVSRVQHIYILATCTTYKSPHKSARATLNLKYPCSFTESSVTDTLP